MPKEIYHIILVAATYLATMPAARAQYSPTPDSICRINAEGQAVSRSHFQYDAQERQTGVAHLVWNKKTGLWVGTFREVVEYDPQGNVVARQTSFWDTDDDDWRLGETETAEFDTAGRQTAVEVMRWNRERRTWIGERKRHDEYDERGKHTRQETFRWDDDMGKWTPSEAVETKYHSTPPRQKKSDTRQTWRDGEWQNVEMTEYEYDGKTNALRSSTRHEWLDNAWAPQTRTAYTRRTENGVVAVCSHSLRFAGGQWVNDEKVTTLLDSHGAEVAITREKWAGIIWNVVQKERIDIKYDQWGNRTHEARYIMTGTNTWAGRSVTDRTFSEYGDVLTEVRMEWDTHNQTWKGVVNTKAEYSAAGDVIAEQKQKWDRKGRRWVPQSKSSYQYDDEHNRTAESTSSWNPLKNAYEEFFRGRASYRLNRDGNIAEVVEQTWENGKWRMRQTTRYY